MAAKLKEIEKMKTYKVKNTENNFSKDSEVRFDGKVYRWTTNDRVPPADAIVSYGIDKLPNFSKEAHDETRSTETQAFLANYRKQMENWEPSAEERYEMRAAYGSGSTVVNMITGKKYKV
mgnify:CR=1 FL=1